MLMSSFTSCNSSSSSSIWRNHNMCLRELLWSRSEYACTTFAMPEEDRKVFCRASPHLLFRFYYRPFWSSASPEVDFFSSSNHGEITSVEWYHHHIEGRSHHFVIGEYSASHRTVSEEVKLYISRFLAITPFASKIFHFIRTTWQQLYHQLARCV